MKLMKKTNNSYLYEKIKLREKLINDIKWDIFVLDCYWWEWVIWSNIWQKRKVVRIWIDKKKYNNWHNLIWDNLKVLPTLDLNKFNVIDLDAYWYPDRQLELVINKWYKWIVFCTFISWMWAMWWLTKNIFNKIWYNYKDVSKIKTLFSKDYIEKTKWYLYSLWIRKIYFYLKGEQKNKLYTWFCIK